VLSVVAELGDRRSPRAWPPGGLPASTESRRGRGRV